MACDFSNITISNDLEWCEDNIGYFKPLYDVHPISLYSKIVENTLY